MPTRASPETRIVLLAGGVRPDDRPGHHDYVGGCSLLADLLGRTAGVRAMVVRDGWPDDAAVLERAACLVFYEGGGGKQAFFGAADRIDAIQCAVDRGAGIVMIHQCVAFPPEHAARAGAWLGGTYVTGVSGRGHWETRHDGFPRHEVTSGVQPWRIKDGWLNRIQFADGAGTITPLVWAGSRYRGSSEGGSEDVASWVCERARGGRSFCFTGLDAHSAWSHAGLRQLIVNGILWSAGVAVPERGAPSGIEAHALSAYLTPRSSPMVRSWHRIGKLVRKAIEARGAKW